MKKTFSVFLLAIVAGIPLAAATKDTGKTVLKDVQPAGTTQKGHKHQQFDLSLSTPSGKDYTCRSKEGEKLKATEFPVGSNISYQIKGDKGKIKTESGKTLDCTIVRVADSAPAPPPK